MNASSEPSQEINFQNRQARLLKVMSSANINVLALNAGPTLYYLTGLSFHLSERPAIAMFSQDAPPILIIPELESAKTAHLPYETIVFRYAENPAGWELVFKNATQTLNLKRGNIGVEPGRLRFLELRLLEKAISDCQFISAQEVIATLRMRKDTNEISAMCKAVEIAQNALTSTLSSISMGITERELAAELTLQLYRSGSDADIPFSPIVSTGPNSANPHAVPSARHLSNGDLLVIDWGASFNGYYSDITRTFAIGELSIEYKQIAQTVLEANLAAQSAGYPRVPAKKIDEAARTVITHAGYGEYFTHRTGHGLGMESHEEPYIHADNPLLLEPGMTFTIEPGIYLPDRGGVRIEDDVLITDTGLISLTNFPRPVQQIA